MTNYEFVAKWVFDQQSAKPIRVLDYGCGSGTIVTRLLSQDVEAYGCDLFYDGGDYSKFVDSDLLNRGVIRKMENNSIPFPSGYFNYVVSNQVLEHVVDLESVLSEIHRVLVPGGVVLSLFPSINVWREGHCGIPFLHWFSKGSSARVYYAALFRSIGFGYHKGTKGIIQWSNEFCQWLDKWTYYRNPNEICSTYEKFFSGLSHIEDYWLQQRLGKKRFFVAWLPSSVQQFIVRKLACDVFVARKSIK